MTDKNFLDYLYSDGPSIREWAEAQFEANLPQAKAVIERRLMDALLKGPPYPKDMMNDVPDDPAPSTSTL